MRIFSSAYVQKQIIYKTDLLMYPFEFTFVSNNDDVKDKKKEDKKRNSAATSVSRLVGGDHGRSYHRVSLRFRFSPRDPIRRRLVRDLEFLR